VVCVCGRGQRDYFGLFLEEQRGEAV